MVMMAWNTWKTIAGQEATEAPVQPTGPVLDIQLTPVTAPVVAKA
jgi:hypothetical protein